MDFFSAINNVTGAKQIPDREEIEGLAWSVKRFLSMHSRLLPYVSYLDQFYFTLGAARFYELMVYCMPSGQYRMRSVKKAVLPKPELSDELWRKVWRHFKIKPKEVPVLLQFVSTKELEEMFGMQKVKRRKNRKRKR